MNDYYNKLLKANQTGNGILTKKEHIDYQTKIVNGFRENLGLEMLDSFTIVSFKPDKN